MSFFPILSGPNCIGRTTLHNFPPNNGEEISKSPCLVNLTWAHDGVWHSLSLDELTFGSSLSVNRRDIDQFMPEHALPLLSLSTTIYPKVSGSLPIFKLGCNTPAWRATLELVSPFTSTGYQGELDPFPVTGSLLAFPPFIQFGDGIENYMLLLNLEENPQPRATKVSIYKSCQPSDRCGLFEVQSNSISVINLDGLFEPDDLPAVACQNMSGIPLFFSKTNDGSFLSLEHTHPPASMTIHGKRWETQKLLKQYWFKKLGCK